MALTPGAARPRPRRPGARPSARRATRPARRTAGPRRSGRAPAARTATARAPRRRRAPGRRAMAPGTEPRPPSIMAIRPLVVAHMPNIGVIWCLAGGDQEAGEPADGRGQHEGQHQRAPHRHADELGRAPVVDDACGRRGRSGCGAAPSRAAPRRGRATTSISRCSGRKKNGPTRRRARRRRARGKALRWRGSSRVAASSICIHTAKLEIIEAMAAPVAERAEAQPLHVEAGQRRAGDDDQRHRQGADAEPRERVGAEIGAGHDGRAVGQVEPAHGAEDQREAERQQRVGRAHHRPRRACSG